MVPILAFAQTAQNLRGLLGLAGDLLNMLIPILIALTLVIFFWGLAMYVRGAGESATEGKSIMIAGLLALFIMVSVWGIIRLFQNTLGVQGSNPIPPPHVPTLR